MMLMDSYHLGDGTIIGTQRWHPLNKPGQIQYGGDISDVLSAAWTGIKAFTKPILNDEKLRSQAQDAISKILRAGIKKGSTKIAGKIKQDSTQTPPLVKGSKKRSSSTKASVSTPAKSDARTRLQQLASEGKLTPAMKKRLSDLIGGCIAQSGIKYGSGIKILK